MKFASGIALPLSADAPPDVPVVSHARRFTLDGSAQLERLLEHVCHEVRVSVLHTLPTGTVEAILLGGGYGRGEGGVLRTNTGDHPYNDLEFYVALRGPRWLNQLRHGAALHDLAHQLTLIAGVEVELQLLSLRELRRGGVTMFSYDLVMGHRWAYGDDRLLAGCEHHHKADRIPLAETARLLLNRSSGLLFARERLGRAEFTDDDADFVARNLAKARLALGDAVLAAAGRYHWSCRERHQRLREHALLADLPEWFSAVLHHHRTGVEFKLHPSRDVESRATQRAAHEEISALSYEVWRWIETRRLGTSFASARDYALSTLDKCPGTPVWRNLALNALRCRTLARRYPRERLFNTLPLLLWEPAVIADPTLLRHAQTQLHTHAITWPGLVRSYEAIWQRFR